MSSVYLTILGLPYSSELNNSASSFPSKSFVQTLYQLIFCVQFKSVLTKIQPPVFLWASYPNTLGPAEEMYWYPLSLQILSEAGQNVQDSHSNNEIHISGELMGTPEEY